MQSSPRWICRRKPRLNSHGTSCRRRQRSNAHPPPSTPHHPPPPRRPGPSRASLSPLKHPPPQASAPCARLWLQLHLRLRLPPPLDRGTPHAGVGSRPWLNKQHKRLPLRAQPRQRLLPAQEAFPSAPARYPRAAPKPRPRAPPKPPSPNTIKTPHHHPLPLPPPPQRPSPAPQCTTTPPRVLPPPRRLSGGCPSPRRGPSPPRWAGGAGGSLSATQSHHQMTTTWGRRLGERYRTVGPLRTADPPLGRARERSSSSRREASRRYWGGKRRKGVAAAGEGGIMTGEGQMRERRA